MIYRRYFYRIPKMNQPAFRHINFSENWFFFHSISKFQGNPIKEDEYNGNTIGFLGNRHNGAKPTTGIITYKMMTWEKKKGLID